MRLLILIFMFSLPATAGFAGKFTAQLHNDLQVIADVCTNEIKSLKSGRSLLSQHGYKNTRNGRNNAQYKKNYGGLGLLKAAVTQKVSVPNRSNQPCSVELIGVGYKQGNQLFQYMQAIVKAKGFRVHSTATIGRKNIPTWTDGRVYFRLTGVGSDTSTTLRFEKRR